MRFWVAALCVCVGPARWFLLGAGVPDRRQTDSHLCGAISKEATVRFSCVRVPFHPVARVLIFSYSITTARNAQKLNSVLTK